jgi:hypothetical protein
LEKVKSDSIPEQSRSKKTNPRSLRILRKKFVALATLFAILLAGMSLTFIHFLTNDSPFERGARSSISKFFRSLASLDVDDYTVPTSSQQIFLLDEESVFFTNKLVYGETQKLTLYYSSPELPSATILQGSENQVDLLGRGIDIPLGPSVFSRPLIVDSISGFDLNNFTSQQVSLEGLSPGWHQILIELDAGDKYLPFFIEPKELITRVLFVESTNTFKAYVSDAGLRTNYANPSNLSGAFTRPVAYPANYKIVNYLDENVEKVNCADHLINADLILKQRLEGHGLSFDVVSDEWLEDPKNLDEVDLVILGTHNEYWSSGKFHTLTNFFEHGGNMMVLGGNTAFRFIEAVNGHFDLFWGNGVMRTQKSEFVNSYLGSYFDSRDYGTWSHFKTSNTIPTFLDDVALSEEFGHGSDFDYCSKGYGASGYETDKLLKSSSDFEVVASGQNFLGGADIVYRKTDSDGKILNFGSVSLWHGMGDQTISAIVRQFLLEVGSIK